jgi:hypothetical protein
MEIKKTEIFFKALLHIFILFVLLLSLFWIVISKIQTNLMTDAVKNSLSNVIKNLKSSNSQLLDNTKNIMSPYSHLINTTDILSSLKKKYSAPDEKVTLNNAYVKNLSYVYVILFFIVILTFIGTLYGSCTYKNFPFWFIIKENILTFIFIAIIEAMFFYYIAMKYAPVLPSDVNTIVKTRLQHNLLPSDVNTIVETKLQHNLS